MANVDGERDGWVTPWEVAEAMVKLLEDEALGEVNDAGPDARPGKGLITSRAHNGVDLVWELLGDVNVWGGGQAASRSMEFGSYIRCAMVMY